MTNQLEKDKGNLEEVEIKYIEALEGLHSLEIETKKIVEESTSDVNTLKKKLNDIHEELDEKSKTLTRVEKQLKNKGASLQ